MTFITDRSLEDIQRVKRGATDEETLSRSTLRPTDFQRWKEALIASGVTSNLPDITKDTQINCTNPTQAIANIPEHSEGTIAPTNDCWYYWKAINDLKNNLPEDSDIDLTWFPSNMERLTFANVNALEAVMEYWYNYYNSIA